MEKTKNNSIYLDEVQIKYLSLMSMISGLNKSQYIRTLLDDDMLANEEICKTYEKILYK